MRFGTFDLLQGVCSAQGLPERFGKPTVDTTTGFLAGIAEAALCQTPNQVIAIKMIHDQSPSGPNRYRGLAHCMGDIWRCDGFGGFFQGVGPAVLKGAVTNSLRFLWYGQITRLMQETSGTSHGSPASNAGSAVSSPPPLAAWQSMLAGGTAGAMSAVVSQPIDTVKANMMGLDSKRYRSGLHCTAELVRAGGVAALFYGLGPRVVRVFIEVGLQFTLFESVGRMLDRVLHSQGPG